MREFNRRRVAAAKSRRATPDELREASQRYKEIQDELRQIDLAPETKHGEERLDRYERELRLQSMREEFQATVESPLPVQRNGLFLALIMTAASLMLCAFCFGASYFGIQLLTQAPSPQDTATGFWSAMETQDYLTVHDSYLSAALQAQQSSDQFTQLAKAADKQYGHITAATLKESTVGKTASSLTYQVVRTPGAGKPITYLVTLTMTLHQTSWTISDYGTLFTPSTRGHIPWSPLAHTEPLADAGVTFRGARAALPFQ